MSRLFLDLNKTAIHIMIIIMMSLDSKISVDITKGA